MATRRQPNVDVKDIVEITIAEHTAIHDAILSRNADKARDAMDWHIIHAAKRVGIVIPSDR